MKVKFFNAHTKGLNWRIINEPFTKVQVDLIFGRNKRDRAFIPLVGMNDLRDNDFVSITKNSKGTNLIVPSVSTDDGFLVFLVVEGGFRGGVNLYHNDGASIIAEASASAACESAIAVSAIMAPGTMLVVKETGRYGIYFHVYKARVDEVCYSKLSKADFQFLFEGGQDQES